MDAVSAETHGLRVEQSISTTPPVEEHELYASPTPHERVLRVPGVHRHRWRLVVNAPAIVVEVAGAVVEVAGRK